VIRFRLVGGPFDGGERDTPWTEAPLEVWVKKDPSSTGPLGLRAWPRQRPGAHPYCYADVEGDVHVYVSSRMSDEGWYEIVRTIEPTAA
jgi:hypothetical protein